MSLFTAIADAPLLLIGGALAGVLTGPAAAATSVTVPAGQWPWQSGSRRWLLGDPASRRRRVLLALLAGVVLGSLMVTIGWRPAVLAFLGIGLFGSILAAIDLEHHRLPDRLVLTAALSSGVVLLVDAALTGSWSSVLRGLSCAAAAFVVFLVMALISPSGMGFGDVKLAALLSLHTGWLSWQLAVLAVLGGFAAGAVTALVLVLARRATLSTAIPFGPALLAGAWLAVLVFAPLS